MCLTIGHSRSRTTSPVSCRVPTRRESTALDVLGLDDGATAADGLLTPAEGVTSVVADGRHARRA